MQDESMDKLPTDNEEACSDDECSRDHHFSQKLLGEISETDKSMKDVADDVKSSVLFIDHQGSKTIETESANNALTCTETKKSSDHDESIGIPNESKESADFIKDNTSKEDIVACADDKMQGSNDRLSSISFNSSRLKRLSVLRKSHLEAGEHSREKSWGRCPQTSSHFFKTIGDGKDSRINIGFSDMLQSKLHKVKASKNKTKGQEQILSQLKGVSLEEVEPNFGSLRTGMDKRSRRALMEAGQKIADDPSLIKLKNNQWNKFDQFDQHSLQAVTPLRSSPHSTPGGEVSYSYLDHLHIVSQSQRASSCSDPEDSQDLISQEPEEDFSLNYLIQLGNLMEGRVVGTDSAASSLTSTDHGKACRGISKILNYIKTATSRFFLVLLFLAASITSWHWLKINALQIPVSLSIFQDRPPNPDLDQLIRYANDAAFKLTTKLENRRLQLSGNDQFELSRRLQSIVSYLSMFIEDVYAHQSITINDLENLIGDTFFSSKEISSSLGVKFFENLSDLHFSRQSHRVSRFVRSRDCSESMQQFMTMTKVNSFYSFHAFPSLQEVSNTTKISNSGNARIPQLPTQKSVATLIVNTTMQCSLSDPIYKTQIYPQIIQSRYSEYRAHILSKNFSMIPQKFKNASEDSPIGITEINSCIPSIFYEGEENLFEEYYSFPEEFNFELKTLKRKKLFVQHAFLRRSQIAEASNIRWLEALLADFMPCQCIQFSNEKMCFVSTFTCNDTPDDGFESDTQEEEPFENSIDGDDKPLMEVVSDFWARIPKNKIRRLRRILGFEGLVQRRKRSRMQSQNNT